MPRPIRGQRITAQAERTERGAGIAGLEVLDGGAVQFLRRGGSSRPQSDPHIITRLAVLKAAAAFDASRPDMKSADVLTVADRWLAWVERPERSCKPCEVWRDLRVLTPDEVVLLA